jgi:hypothetical protein
MSKDTRRGRGHVPCSICYSGWKCDVCNGCTSLDIAHAVGFFNRYMSKPEKEHWETINRGFHVFAWHYYLWIVLPRKSRIGQSVRDTWIY